MEALATGTVVGVNELGQGLRHVTIETDRDFEFAAGQHLALQGPGSSSTHYYSFASAPTELLGRRFELLVGQPKNGAAPHFAVGDALALGRSGGARLLEALEPGRPLVLVGIGTGVAPLRALYQKAHLETRRVTLLAGAREPGSLPFHEEFSRAALEGKLVYLPVFSVDGPVGERRGRVQSFLPDLLPTEAFFVLCGSVPMVRSTKERLLELGVEETSIHGEGYGG